VNKKAVRDTSLLFWISERPTRAQFTIREHFERLVGKPRLLQPLVNQDEAVSFAAQWNAIGGDSCQPCCDADSFRFDILGPPHSPWNKSASRVFRDSYIDYYNLPSTTAVMMDVEDSFFVRLRTLKRSYNASRLMLDQRRSVSSKARRYQRKAQVCSS